MNLILRYFQINSSKTRERIQKSHKIIITLQTNRQGRDPYQYILDPA